MDCYPFAFGYATVNKYSRGARWIRDDRYAVVIPYPADRREWNNCFIKNNQETNDPGFERKLLSVVRSALIETFRKVYHTWMRNKLLFYHQCIDWA